MCNFVINYGWQVSVGARCKAETGTMPETTINTIAFGYGKGK